MPKNKNTKKKMKNYKINVRKKAIISKIVKPIHNNGPGTWKYWEHVAIHDYIQMIINLRRRLSMPTSIGNNIYSLLLFC